jgi:hypothetical protein
MAAFESLLAAARKDLATKQSPSARKVNRLLTAAEDAATEFAEVYRHERYVARLWSQHCSRCGHVFSGLEGLYDQRVHPRTAARITKRLIDKTLIDEAFLSPIELDEPPPVSVPVCEECITAHFYQDTAHAKAA